MKLAIIADDLTGANDSGVQLARHGLKTSVLFNMDEDNIRHYDAVVFDTDSRSITPEDAYQRVHRAAELLLRNGFGTIFKKWIRPCAVTSGSRSTLCMMWSNRTS